MYMCVYYEVFQNCLCCINDGMDKKSILACIDQVSNNPHFGFQTLTCLMSDVCVIVGMYKYVWFLCVCVVEYSTVHCQ